MTSDTNTLRPFADVDYFRELKRLENRTLTEDFLRNCIDLFLMEAEQFEFDRPERSMKNDLIVEYVINHPIVIERSPPCHTTLIQGNRLSQIWYSWVGSNHRPPVPQTGALTNSATTASLKPPPGRAVANGRKLGATPGFGKTAASSVRRILAPARAVDGVGVGRRGFALAVDKIAPSASKSPGLRPG